MYNTIMLLKGEACLARREYKEFEKGDTIWGIDRTPEEIKRWSIEQEREAKEELAKYTCTYHEDAETWGVEEYALEYCECDEDGEFVQGSDYDLAEEK